MPVTDFDISGWIPDWAPAHAQLAAHRPELRRRQSRRIVDAWLVWNLELNEWFADLPVVLLFDDGRQVEISWQKFDDLSITWNTVDVTVAPIAWVTSPLIWRSQAHETLRAVTGQTVASVASTEHLFTTRDLASARASSVWLASGLWLQTARTGLHIFNALDENGLSNEPPPASEKLRLLEL